MMSDADEMTAARRPLKTRNTKWAAWLAAKLARANVSPNAISLWSIVFAAIAAAAFVGTRLVERPIGDASLFLLAIVGIQGRLLCNMMDGMVAVEGGKRTPSGELFNEVPDRIGDTFILVAAGYAGSPGWGPTLGWAAALLAMFTAYIRAVGKAAGANAHFVGPMAKPHRMAVLTVFCLMSANAALFFGDDNGLSVSREQVIRGPIDLALIIIIVGCIPTLCRRLSRIVADLGAKS